MKPHFRYLIERRSPAGAAAALSAIGALVASTAAIAQPSSPYYGHMWTGWGWFFGPLTMIVVLVLVVALAVLLVRWLGGYGPGSFERDRPGKTAPDILRERFARGEIDKEEFEERRRILGA